MCFLCSIYMAVKFSKPFPNLSLLVRTISTKASGLSKINQAIDHKFLKAKGLLVSVCQNSEFFLLIKERHIKTTKAGS